MGFWSWFKENITDGLTEFVFAIGLFFVTAFATAIEVSNYGLLGLLCLLTLIPEIILFAHGSYRC